MGLTRPDKVWPGRARLGKAGAVGVRKRRTNVTTSYFKIGDLVRPRPEWKNDPNRIPTGTVRSIEVWGDGGAIYVEGEQRAFAGYVFEKQTGGIGTDESDRTTQR
jgi:hypothetical protein